MKDLENYLTEFELVLWVDDPETVRFLKKHLSAPPEKIAILSRWECAIDGAAFRRLTEDEAAALRKLYNTYEFSDRFRRLSRSELYGGLWNYVASGLLTPEEAVDALVNGNGN